MEQVTITISNDTDVSIDLCRASVQTETLLPGSIRQELTSSKSWIQGHSAIGSFVIQRIYADFKFQSWGALRVMKREKNGQIVFEVLQKK